MKSRPAPRPRPHVRHLRRRHRRRPGANFRRTAAPQAPSSSITPRSTFRQAIRKEILRVAEQQPISAGDLSQLNFRLGEVFAEAALTACKRFRIATKKIALIGTHGQTIFHQGQPVPYLGRPTASTLQIGEPSIIAARTGITTVADFRPADIALRRPRRPASPLRRLSSLPPSQTRPRLPQSRRHRQHHRAPRSRQALASFRLRHRPRQHADRRPGPAFHARPPALRQKRHARPNAAAHHPRSSTN